VAQPLRLARLQDASAWAGLAVLLLLAPVHKVYDLIGVAHPRPAGAFIAAGLALLMVAALVARAGGRRVVYAAATADLVAAAALVAWLLVDSPANRTRGTVLIALAAASLAFQTCFDLLMVSQAGPAVDRGSDRRSKR
jgi:hypothetical protein